MDAVKIEPIHRRHFEALEKQGVSEVVPAYRYLDNWLENSRAFAGVADEGVLGVGGLLEQNPGNFRLWVFRDPRLTRKYRLVVNRMIVAYLDTCGARRIEAVLQLGNVAGHRWVTKILGFTMAHIMRAFDEDGDAVLYERISDDEPRTVDQLPRVLN